MLAVDLFIENPGTAPARYDEMVGEKFDAFLRTGRRFSFLIGHPWLLKPGLAMSVSTESIAKITLAVMGNLVDNSTPGAAGKVMWMADKGPRPRRPHPAQDSRRRLITVYTASQGMLVGRPPAGVSSGAAPRRRA